jgi:hypothetical protein
MPLSGLFLRQKMYLSTTIQGIRMPSRAKSYSPQQIIFHELSPGNP